MRKDYFDLRVRMCTIGTGNDCFVFVACKYREIVLFFSYKG